MRADLGSSLSDIEGKSWTTRSELAQHMRAVIGEAWCERVASSHERLAQRKRIQKQIAGFDAIFLEQTGVGIATHVDFTIHT